MYQKMTAVTASGRTRHLTELYIFYFGLNKISKLVPYTARKVACFSIPFLYEMQCQVTQNVTQTGFGLSLRTRIGLGTFHRPCIGASPWFLDSIGLLPPRNLPQGKAAHWPREPFQQGGGEERPSPCSTSPRETPVGHTDSQRHSSFPYFGQQVARFFLIFVDRDPKNIIFRKNL